MNILARITARKVVFCYFFEQYVLALTGKKEEVLEEIEKVGAHIADKETPPIILADVLSDQYYADVDAEIAYLVQWVFAHDDPDETKKTVALDWEYVHAIAPLFWKYEPLVREKVSSHAVSFSFDQMDVLDRVIFVLGYAEYQEMQTPREVLLNEMIELGKRYGDASSAKLINGIAHKLFE